MKNKIIIYISIISSLLVFSCQKVIDLKLNKDSQKYVIEGFVTKGETVHEVKITKTLPFDQNQAFPTVDNAVVVISDNFGNVETLTLVAPGTYRTVALLGVEGRTYTITVTIGSETFTAQSTIPTEVVLDTLEVIGIPFGTDTIITVLPVRLDQANVANFYQYDIFINSLKISGIFLQDDQFSDGIVNEQPIFGPDFLSGDTVTFDMHCIDKPVYKYFYSIDANTGSTASPANPESNFGTACLGYFSARTSSSKTIVIP